MAVQRIYSGAGVADRVESQGYIRIDPYYLVAKRILDIVVSLIILIPLSIITLVMVIAIRLDSPGPAIYRQKRVGMHGKEFDCLKFRSMYHNADDAIHRAAYKRFVDGQKLNDNEDSAVPYRIGNDPRVTNIGRFIRKTSIDELPQFWNVLVGQMSLVGPRPPIPYEVPHYSARDWLRLSGKPGLTGPWQIYGRAKVTFHEMVEMDINYLHQQSIWGDIKLIALTLPVMLSSRGGA